MADPSDAPDREPEPNPLQETRNDARIKPLTPQGRTDDADADGPSTGQLDPDDEGDPSQAP